MADADALPKFTKQVPTPKVYADPVDQAAMAPATPYEYQDMRGNYWLVRWTGKAWVSTPTTQTVEAYAGYTLDDGSPLVQSKRQFNAATDAAGLIDGIEERIEIARQRGVSSGSFPWWLVALAAAAYYLKKKRRGR